MIKRRDFWVILLLSIVTCGIYSYIYIYQMTKDLNAMAGNDDKYIDPAIAVLLSIVTCGIYTFWWYYSMGNRVQQMGRANNIMVEEGGTAYLLWMVIGSFICGIGYLIGMYLFIKNFNNVSYVYNSGNFGSGQNQGF